MARDINCSEYLKCLDVHARKNKNMDCSECRGQPPSEAKEQKGDDSVNNAGFKVFDPTDVFAESELVAIKRWARVMGRRGGLKGGPARALKLSPERRREIAKNAANARWGGGGEDVG